MPLTTDERLDTLETQMAQMITRPQVLALINSTLTRLSNLETAEASSAVIISSLRSDLQSMKNQIADHETRLDTLEA